MVVKLKWDDIEANEIGYLVRRSDDGQLSWIDLDVLPPNSTSYADLSTLSNGRTYYYSVTALCENCQSNSVIVEYIHNPVLPSNYETLTLSPFDTTIEISDAQIAILREWLLGEDFGETSYDTGTMPFGSEVVSVVDAELGGFRNDTLLTQGSDVVNIVYNEIQDSPLNRDYVDFVKNADGTVTNSLYFYGEFNANLGEQRDIYETPYSAPIPGTHTLSLWCKLSEYMRDSGDGAGILVTTEGFKLLGFIDRFNSFTIGYSYDSYPDFMINPGGCGDKRWEWTHVAVTMEQVPGIVDEVRLYNAGTGYSVSDILTVTGGTGTPVEIEVLTVGTSGEILTTSVVSNGNYTVMPTSPAQVTGGTGNGALFMVGVETYNIKSYINGVPANSKDNVTFNGVKFFDIATIGGNGFVGNLSNIRVTEGILSDADILALYNTYQPQGHDDYITNTGVLGFDYVHPAADLSIKRRTSEILALPQAAGSYSGSVDVFDVLLNSDGTKCFHLSNSRVYETRTTTPYVYDSYSFYSTEKRIAPVPVWFSDDGLHAMCISDDFVTKGVFGIELSEPFNFKETLIYKFQRNSGENGSTGGLKSDEWKYLVPDFKDVSTPPSSTPVSACYNSTGNVAYVLYGNGLLQQYALSTPWDLSTSTVTSSYDFDATDSISQTEGLYVSPDGLRLFVGDPIALEILSYSMSVAGDITTLTSVGSLDVSGQIAYSMGGFSLSSTGEHLYATNYYAVHQYTLSTPWDLSTGSFVQSQFPSDFEQKFYVSPDSSVIYTGSSQQYTMTTPWDISTLETVVYELVFSTDLNFNSPIAFRMKPDGTSFYIATALEIFQFDLSVAEDLSTAIYSSNSFAPAEDEFVDFYIKPDGTSLYILGSGFSTNTIYQYTLSVPWDISTASLTTQSAALAYTTQGVPTLNISDDGSTLFYMAEFPNTVRQYSFGTNWDASTLVDTGKYVTTPFSNLGGNYDSAKYFRIVNGGKDIIYSIDSYYGYG